MLMAWYDYHKTHATSYLSAAAQLACSVESENEWDTAKASADLIGEFKKLEWYLMFDLLTGTLELRGLGGARRSFDNHLMFLLEAPVFLQELKEKNEEECDSGA